MRRDMDRLLVTRPRHGHRHPMRGLRRRRRERVRPEEAPRREPMRGPNRTKDLSEYFSPLLRYLEKSVGRPWDAVYSEIRGAVPPDGVIQQHLYVHLRQFVAIRVFERDGRRFSNLWHGSVVEVRPGVCDFFVCPRTGRLRALPRRPHPRATRNPDVRIAASDRQLHRIAGTWYEIRLEPVPHGGVALRSAFDRVLRVRLGVLDPPRRERALARCYGTGVRYGAVRRTLSRKELRGIADLPAADWPAEGRA